MEDSRLKQDMANRPFAAPYLLKKNDNADDGQFNKNTNTVWSWQIRRSHEVGLEPQEQPRMLE